MPRKDKQSTFYISLAIFLLFHTEEDVSRKKIKYQKWIANQDLKIKIIKKKKGNMTTTTTMKGGIGPKLLFGF